MLARTPKGHEIFLLEGVEDLTMWSRTLVIFGRYQAPNLSYLELVGSLEIEMAQYVELNNFALFIHAIRAHQGTSAVASSIPVRSPGLGLNPGTFDFYMSVGQGGLGFNMMHS